MNREQRPAAYTLYQRTYSRLGRRLGYARRKMVEDGILPDDWSDRVYLEMMDREQELARRQGVDRFTDVLYDLETHGCLHALEEGPYDGNAKSGRHNPYAWADKLVEAEREGTA